MQGSPVLTPELMVRTQYSPSEYSHDVPLVLDELDERGNELRHAPYREKGKIWGRVSCHAQSAFSAACTAISRYRLQRAHYHFIPLFACFVGMAFTIWLVMMASRKIHTIPATMGFMDKQLKTSRSGDSDNPRSSVQLDKLHGVIGLLPDGTPAWVPTPMPEQTDEDRKVANTGFAFNSARSNSIPLDRPGPNFAVGHCREDFPNDLPDASVVIPFYNELLSALLRTLHSILNNTPPHLLREIIVVDDGSDIEKYPDLGEPLDRYFALLPDKVKLIRLPDRRGLMGARMAGAEQARGEILVILDSHIECGPKWLEPLSYRIKKDRKLSLLPYIDGINTEDFTFDRDGLTTYSFSITLNALPYTSEKETYIPRKSAGMPGGVFAIEREWFFELGGYDPELAYYGGEEVELALKIWLCGGRLEAVPCSRIAHIFRSSKYWKGAVFYVPPGVIQRNQFRVGLAWLDEYSKYLKASIPMNIQSSMKPLHNSKIVQERLNCHKFSWYLENVNPNMFIPPDYQMSGSLKLNENLCVDTLSVPKLEGSTPGFYYCHNQLGSQGLYYDVKGYLRAMTKNFSLCITAKFSDDSASVAWESCMVEDPPNKLRIWTIDADAKRVKVTNSQEQVYCLSALAKKLSENVDKFVRLEKCDESDPRQDMQFIKNDQ